MDADRLPSPSTADRLPDPAPPGWPLRPLSDKEVLWLAALDRVPIEDRIEWVEKLKRQVDGINAERASAGRSAAVSLAEPPARAACDALRAILADEDADNG